MSVFPTNRTVPLDKDIGVADPKQTGPSAEREQLSVVLDNLDQGLQQEILDRIAGDGSTDAALQDHIDDTNDAHDASAISVTPTGNLAADDVQEALVELQSELDLAATDADLNQEITDRAAADDILQDEIDGERSLLRLSASGTKSISVAAAFSDRVSATGTPEAQLLLPNGSLVSDFPGATLDFENGIITYVGGTPSPDTFDLIDFSGQAGMYAKYALVLLPGDPNTVLVLPGDEFAATADAVAPPAFSGGVAIGIITVKDDGSAGIGTIENIVITDLAQFIASGSGSGGSGSGSPLDPQDDETFTYYTRSDFAVDGKAFFASTTGTEQILGLSKVILGVGQTLTTLDLTGTQLHKDALVINNVQARLLYEVGFVDENPSVSFSRDGGASWHPATVSLPGANTADEYLGDVVLAELTFEEAADALFEGGGSQASTVSGARVAAIIIPDFRVTSSAFQLMLSTTSVVGTAVGKIYAVASGMPTGSALATSSQTLVAGQDITTTPGFKIFSFDAITLEGGTEYALVVETTDFVGSLAASLALTPTSQNISSATHNGASWLASGSQLAFNFYGTGADLRMIITSGTALSELIGFGVNHVSTTVDGIIGGASWEQRTITASEASTGTIDLVSVRYTPGVHQLHANIGGHDFVAPDFAEVGPSRVQFSPGFFAAGDVVRFYTAYGYVEGSSLSLSKVSAQWDAIVGSNADLASGVATHSTIASAISAIPAGGTILLLNRTFTENVTVNKNCVIEGKGYATVISGTFTMNSSADYSTVRGLKVTGNISLSCNGSFMRDCFAGSSSVITDTGLANSRLIIQE